MTSRLFAKITLVGALALSLACDDPLSPAELAGTYVLRRVGAAELPVKLHDFPASGTWLIADTLVFRADRSGERRRTIEVRSVGGGAERGSYIQGFHFSTGDRIEIHFTCPSGTICSLELRLPVIAHRTPDGLVLAEPPEASESLYYVQVR